MKLQAKLNGRFDIYSEMSKTEEIDTGNSALDAKIKEYMEYTEGQKLQDELRSLLDKKEFKTLENLLLKRLTFCSSGLLAKMGPGYAAMNDLVVIQTAQGLATVLDRNALKGYGVIIGYDHRRCSERFARLAANAFLHLTIPVHLFSQAVPIPFVAFGVLVLNCMAGIMVTGSHSQKNYNGLKMFSSRGTPIDKEREKIISDCVLENLKPWPGAWDMKTSQASHDCQDPFADLYTRYYKDMEGSMIDNDMNSKCRTKITHTSLHGVAHEYMKKAIHTCGFRNFVFVADQMTSDPNFPTVNYPDPTDETALELAIRAAEVANSTVIVANDPSAGLMVVAQQLPDDEWKMFTVDETAALLGWWMWYRSKELRSDSMAKYCMVSSAVSSRILDTMASAEGFLHHETLPGFEWVAGKASECQRNNYKFLFAFEEAAGYMCGSVVMDIDGVTAAMYVAEMVAYLETKHLTLTDKLAVLYNVYGYHVSENSYFVCNNPDSVTDMFNRLRKLDDGDYPKVLGRYNITGTRDVSKGYDSTKTDLNSVLPLVASRAQMLTFYFENGCRATLRKSENENKLMCYTELVTDKRREVELSDVEKELNDIVKLITDEWIQPDVNKFLPQVY